LSLRRRSVPAHDDLRGPDRVRGEQAEGPRDPPGLRRGDQRAGLHARAPLLHRAVGAVHPMTAAPDTGWARLAGAVAEVLPPAEVDGVWIFSPLRREGREWGTAVLSRVDGDRRRIYTARYVLAIKGKERGKF